MVPCSTLCFVHYGFRCIPCGGHGTVALELLYPHLTAEHAECAELF